MSPRLSELERELGELQAVVRRVVARNASLEDRMDKMVRHGKVTDVDPAKQLARIEIGNKDGVSLKSAWVPYAQVAGPDGQGSGNGEFKFHNPPAVGQQCTMFAPNGEFRQAVILPFTWHDKAKSPGDKLDEHVLTFGKLKIRYKKDEYDISLDKADFNIKADVITAKVGNGTFEVHDDFILGQVGDGRFVATAKAAKIRFQQDFVVVADGQVIVSKTPIVGADPDSH